MPFYGYIVRNDNGNIIERGTTNNWDICKTKTNRKKAKFKKFATLKEAREFIRDPENNKQPVKEPKQIKKPHIDGVYFDAGTGRGNGVEAKITDKTGKLLIPSFIDPKKHINEFNVYKTPKGSTNNFGELYAFVLATSYALENNIKHVLGDSELVLKWWSQGRYNSTLPERTKSLIQKAIEKRKEFEKKGGKYFKISGKNNPADLGFHK